MIEVFKTNVQERHQASSLLNELLQQFPESKINFDLDDCDKILRIEGFNFIAEQVMSLVHQNGFKCQLL